MEDGITPDEPVQHRRLKLIAGPELGLHGKHFTCNNSTMSNPEIIDLEARRIIRSNEIECAEKDLLLQTAHDLIEIGSSQFEYGDIRFLLTKSGLSYNPGYQIETENLDGSERFRNSWSALSGDQDWQVKSIIKQLTRLMAYMESE